MPMSLWLAVAGGLAAGAFSLAPFAHPDTLLVEQCKEAMVNVLVNDHDPVAPPPLRLTSVNNAYRGTAEIVSLDTIRYVAGKEPGTDTLSYVVANPAGDTAVGILVVTIQPGDACS